MLSIQRLHSDRLFADQASGQQDYSLEVILNLVKLM